MGVNVNNFYVYALKDPTRSPILPFYIGKGTGARAREHLVKLENNAKGRRIEAIRAANAEPTIKIICDGLTEVQAIALEAEIIGTFGTEATGGLLTNSVIPTGNPPKRGREINIPLGAPERAQLGLSLIKDAVLELAQANTAGITNAEAANSLRLKSDHSTGSKDFLTYSIIGLLLNEGRLSSVDKESGPGSYYLATAI